MSILKQSIIDIWETLPHKSAKADSKRMNSLLSDEDKEWLTSNNLTIRQAIWLLSHDCKSIPVCQTCGGPIDFASGRTYCSIQCARQDKDVQAKALESTKRTMHERYGVDYVSQVPEFIAKSRAKAEETNLERYGCCSVLKSKDVQEKVKKTCLERYGYENAMQSDAVKEKVRKTCLERYGHENAMQSDDIQEKRRNSCIERYGKEWATQSDDIQEKIRKTCQERHGSNSYFGSEAFKQSHSYERDSASIEKAKNTCLERYNATTWTQTAEGKAILSERISLSRRQGSYTANKTALQMAEIELLTSEEEYATSKIISYRCNRCGLEFQSKETNSQMVHCPTCVKRHWSLKEKELAEWIRKISPYEIVENDRKVLAGKELDIWIPDAMLAVEFDGSWWHSTEWSGPKRHLEKTLSCKEKGIRLVHVFEWEWDSSREKICSLIKDILVPPKRIYARNCHIVELGQKEYGEFLQKWHLQGSSNSSVRIGLSYENEIVAVAGWGKSRFKRNEFELHRMCVKGGLSVVGGFSRMIAHSGLEQFISYVDLAHFTGDGYLAAGFIQIGTTPPGYHWTKGSKVLSRQMAQKSKLPKLLGEVYDPSMTEVQNMAANGWHQVFDCGNLKMEWRKAK